MYALFDDLGCMLDYEAERPEFEVNQRYAGLRNERMDAGVGVRVFVRRGRTGIDADGVGHGRVRNARHSDGGEGTERGRSR